ncbi:DNA-3-methyladenine glycosylase family protein [Neofamilia massiliensis]|uniref:DNA-3-methyladenine glycosylase family protein n=1 Tax=Neofamilia massiliensis TaxID=1673724 RepID=UPI0006BB5FB6|nr:DNA glycosylase [Neofamilia massiliensis]
MNISIHNDQVRIKNLENFNPEHIFECGQAFRWERQEDGSYTVVAFNRVINVSLDKEDVVIKNTSLEDFENVWIDYFDLKADYKSMQETFNEDPIMQEAIEYGKGIRILKQDPFETTISFIISANNRIPQIKKSIELIARTYGDSIGFYEGKEYFSFPSPQALAQVDVSELREICRVGFRDQRIIDVSKMVACGDLDLNILKERDREDIKNVLITLPGIGPKIADCITLFAYNKKDSFPVDVWIKRVMEFLYFKEDVNKNKLAMLSREKFGPFAGLAQQYLFYYGRENSIGVEK